MKNYRLVYSGEFVDGLIEAVAYIKKDSLRVARIFERKVRKRVRLLKQFPESGRASTDTRLEGIRILVIGNYLVLYEVIAKKKLVYLHAFCHGARDYPHLYKHLFDS